MSSKNFIFHTMTEVMAKFQHADLVNEEEDFLVITEEDLEANLEENRNSCYGKIMAEREPNIQNIKHCLHRAYRGHEFRICKIGTGLY